MRFGIGACRHLDNHIPTPPTTTMAATVDRGLGKVGCLGAAMHAIHEVIVYTPRAQSGSGGCTVNALCVRLTIPVYP